MGREKMRIYLAQPQYLDVEGGKIKYRPGYYDVAQELAEKWIGERLAVEATLDNSHSPPAEGFAGDPPAKKKPVPLTARAPKEPAPSPRTKPTPLTVAEPPPPKRRKAKKPPEEIE